MLPNQKFYLSEFIGKKAYAHNKKIGFLSEIAVVEKERVPEATHLLIKRPFGYPTLLVPWKKLVEIVNNKIILDIDKLEDYEKTPDDSQILIKDHVLDKKVLDLEGNEVEVVYDIKLEIRNGKMYVSDVDCSKYGLLRRIGLKWLANLIKSLAESVKEEAISWSYIQPLEQLSSFKGAVKLKVLKEKLTEIHPVDLADILEELDHEQRLAVFNQLDTEQASDTLEEVEPRVQRDLISSIDIKRAAEIINDMTPAQAADVLAILPASDADNIMLLMDKDAVIKIQILLDKHDEKVLNFATSHYLSFAPSTKVDEVLSQYRTIAKDKDVIMYIYVLDENTKLLGVVDIHELLQAETNEILENIMVANVISLGEDATLSEAASMFNRYSFRAIPIVNEAEELLGVIPFRDIMNLKHHFI